jgi:hypothetical protein
MSKPTPSRATREGAILGTLALSGAAVLSVKGDAGHRDSFWQRLNGLDALPEPSVHMRLAPHGAF